MSLQVLDIELAEKNVVSNLGVYYDVQVFEVSFGPPKIHQKTHQTLQCTQNIDCKSGAFDYSLNKTMLAGQRRAKHFAKGVENGKLLSPLPGKELDSLDYYGCQNIQPLKTCWLSISYPYRHKTDLH